jgi:hypothetical protein
MASESERMRKDMTNYTGKEARVLQCDYKTVQFIEAKCYLILLSLVRGA